MPTFPCTRGTLTLTGGEFQPEPVRFTYTPGALSLAPGSFGVGAGLRAEDGKRLPRLQRQQSYWNTKGEPTAQMQGHHQMMCERIEARFADIEDVLAQIQQAQADAAEAKQQSLATERKINLVNSRTEPVAGVVSASSDGTVTIANHQRVYGDGTSVNVTGGTLPGNAQGSFVRVYYNDPARVGGAVTYLGTTDEVVTEGDRHVVGGVNIPVAGLPAQEGNYPFPPGYVPDYRDLVEFPA